MSPVESKKWQCRHVDFRGPEPYKWLDPPPPPKSFLDSLYSCTWALPTVSTVYIIDPPPPPDLCFTDHREREKGLVRGFSRSLSVAWVGRGWWDIRINMTDTEGISLGIGYHWSETEYMPCPDSKLTVWPGHQLVLHGHYTAKGGFTMLVLVWFLPS